MVSFNPNQNSMLPPEDGADNPYGYAFWNKMRNSVYYEVPQINDPYIFQYQGQLARLSVSPYPSDPRLMKLSLVDTNGNELYEITEHLRDAFHEVDWTRDNPGTVPLYSALCKDAYFEDGAGVFDQLTRKHLCVPIYTPTGRIAVHRGYQLDNNKAKELPEYLFDDVALRAYDKAGVMEYDRQVQAYEQAKRQWPGSDRTWALAVDNYYDPKVHIMRGIPKPTDYIGNRKLEAIGDVMACVRNPYDIGEGFTRTPTSSYVDAKTSKERLRVEREAIRGGTAKTEEEFFDDMVWYGLR